MHDASTALGRCFWSDYTFLQAYGDDRLPYWPLERILALQRRRLRSMVRHACATVPRYREAMAAMQMRAEEIRSAGDLARLPLIDGEDLAGSPDRFSSEMFPEARTLALRSSGTAGRPKTVRYSHAALFQAMAQGQRQRAVLAHFVGRRFGYREMTAHRSESVSAQVRRFYEAHAWVPRRMDLERARLPLEAGFDEAVERINAFRPDVLFGYGSYVGAFYRWATVHGRRVHRPRVVWYGADRMADADRKLLEHELGVPVVSSYQADEALRIGFQCEVRQGFHLSLDALAVRIVDEEGSDVGPGETGELVLSNLTNRATVLLNYRLGDRVTVGAGPCPCGRTLPTIERIEGRADDLLLLADGEVRHPLPLIQELQKVAGVVRVQIVQQEVARFTLYVVGASGMDWDAARIRLERIVRSTVGGAAAIGVARVEAIPREPSGKVRAVVSHCRRTA